MYAEIMRFVMMQAKSPTDMINNSMGASPQAVKWLLSRTAAQNSVVVN